MAKKVGRKLLAIAAVVTAVQVPVLWHYNALFAASSNATKEALSRVTEDQPTMSPKVKSEIEQLQAQYHVEAVSQDNRYAAYVDDQNVLHLEDLQSGKDIQKVTNACPVQYVCWLQDNSVFVGEQLAPGSLLLKMVSASDGSETEVSRFSVSSTAAITNITYSTYTNDIYVLVNTNTTSAVYHIDTMKHITDVPIGSRYIMNMAVSETGGRLYVEDRLQGKYNVIYFDSNDVVHQVQLNAALIQVIGNNVYYGDVDANGLVTTVYKMDENGASTLVSTLQTPTKRTDIEVSADGKVSVLS